MSVSVKRKQIIQDLLNAEGSVQVAALAHSLSVSEMTIRRDLSELEKIGILKRNHGGAVKELSRSYEPPFALRRQNYLREKQLIAQEAIRFVSEGDTIAIDSGTTAIEFAMLLMDYHNLTIVTPSLHIAMLFLAHPTIKVIVSGGEVRKKEGSLVGAYTKLFFDNLYFDSFFMSSAGISSEVGLSEYIIEDATIKNLIMSHAKNTIALMTSDKFEITTFARVCRLEDITILITDKEPEMTLRQILTTYNIEIRVAKTQGEKL